MRSQSPRLIDVARVSGVSTATVSRVLSHPEMVAEETRIAVQAAIRETGYRPNLQARNLRMSCTGSLLVLVPNLGNPFFSRILAGIEARAGESGLGVLVLDTSSDDIERLRPHLTSSRADGIVLLDGTVPVDPADAALPPLVCACEWLPGDGFPSVTIDNAEGVRLAIAHLHEHGHRAIGHVMGPPANVLTRARAEAVRATLASLGLPARDEWFFAGDFSPASGEAAAAAFLALDKRPTAVFCASDQMAFGFISALHHAGVSVPQDVSVVGFDDQDIAQRFIPALTTIHQPRFDIGRTAADLLIARIESRVQRPESRVLTPTLVERASVRRLRQRAAARKGTP